MVTATVSKNGRTPARQQVETVELPALQKQRFQLRLVGDAPFLCHAWSQKARKEMLDKQMKKAKQAKAAKDPEQDFIDSLYWITPKPETKAEQLKAIKSGKAKFGMMAIGFKHMAVNAVSHVDGLTKVLARGAFHVNPGEELIEILDSQPHPREDMVRVGMGTSDIRYRAEFPLPWSVIITIHYNASVISAEQITHLYEIAGFSIGLGEWRPEKGGYLGLFHVDREFAG